MKIGGRRLVRWLGGTIAFVLIGAAVLLTVLRLALPFASDYRVTLEERVADYLDTPVSIGSMEVEWHGLGPRLRLVDLRLQGPPPARRPVHFDEAFVDLRLTTGGRGGLPVSIRSMSLVGLNLEVALEPGGRMAMLGERVPVEEVVPKGKTPPPFVQRIADWLLETERLQLLDASIDLIEADGERARISGIDLRLINDGDRHRASLSMQLPPPWGDSIDAVIDVTGGRIGEWAQWDGRVWVDAADLALRRWSGLYPELPIHVRDGRASFSTWIEFGGGHLREIALEGGGSELALAGGPMEAPANFERLAGKLRWQGRGNGDWELDVGELEVQRDGRAWPTTGLSVARTSVDGAAHWQADAGFLRLEDTLALARLSGLAEELPPRLGPLAPRGDLFELRAAGAPSGTFELQTRFEDAGWIATDGIPGARGIDGRLRADAGGARVRLATRDARVDASRILAAPLRFDRAAGDVDVAWDDEGWRIRGENLELRNADGVATGGAEVAVSADGGVDLAVAADFDDVAVPAVTRYLPHREIPDEVIRGLERTLQGGRIPSGELRLNGSARDFPYRDGEGTFTVDLAARDARIDYAPGWPALEDMSGTVRFDGPSLRIDADTARIFGIESQRLTGRIPDLEEGRLSVSAEADAPVADLIRLVNESPLEEELGRFFRGARGAGRAPFGLDLKVPLRSPEDTRVAGRLDLQRDSLIQPRFDLDLRELDGTLRFTRRGIEARDLGTTVRGQRMKLDARVDEGAGGDNVITARGRMEPAALVPEIAAALDGRVTGAAPWEIDIRVPRGDEGAPIRLAGTSDLRGTAVDLPAPLGKAGDATRRFSFSLPLVEGAGERLLRLAYGDDLRALVELREDGDGEIVSERAAVRFGGAEARLGDEPGLHINGTLQRLDLRGWVREALAGTDIGADGSGNARTDAGQSLSGAPAFGGIDLDVAAAAWSGYRLSDARLRVQRERGDWLLDLDSNEAEGRTRIPANAGAGEPIRVRYDWIDLGLLAPEAAEEPDPAVAPVEDDDGGIGSIDPARVPPLDVRIGRLKTRNAMLNDVAVVTRQSAQGMTIHRLGFRNDALRLEGQGLWSGDPRARTALRLNFRSDDFGSGLTGIGYGGALVSGAGEVTADLEWGGPPWAPKLDALGGYANVQLEDGLIPEVDPGPARLLGLLSLRALPQLLSLDFRSLVQRGFAFDTIRGRVDFADGNAFSRGLEVQGPAGTMIITGRTGLIERDYDQIVQFQPQLSSSLPLIGALSGGPVTGLAVAVVQGVLRNIGADVEEASEFRYSLTGTWADPKVQLVDRSPDSTDTHEPSRPDRGGR